MAKVIHIHMRGRDSKRWVTINGTHVLVSGNGAIVSGPANLKAAESSSVGSSSAKTEVPQKKEQSSQPSTSSVSSKTDTAQQEAEIEKKINRFKSQTEALPDGDPLKSKALGLISKYEAELSQLRGASQKAAPQESPLIEKKPEGEKPARAQNQKNISSLPPLAENTLKPRVIPKSMMTTTFADYSIAPMQKNPTKEEQEHLDKTTGAFRSVLNALHSQGVDLDNILLGTPVQIGKATLRSDITRATCVGGTGDIITNPNLFSSSAFERSRANYEKRQQAGRQRWSVSSAASSVEESAKLTMLHEFAHAVGIRRGSPEKLEVALKSLHASGRLKDPRVNPKDSVEKQIAQWVSWNISEYGSSDSTEADAELVALVLGGGYRRGTLPKELEDHVDQLFIKRST